MNVGVYEASPGGPLYVELPEAVLPPGAERIIEEETPGFFREYPRWLRMRTGKKSKDGRLPVFLYRTQMTPRNIDLNKPAAIQIRGAPYIWFDAHLIYRWGPLPFYGRVWLPRRFVDALNLQPESEITVKIQGYTYPKKRRITIIERYVEILHMGKSYPAETTKTGWRWMIPDTIDGYATLLEGIQRNYMPIAECNKYHGRVIIDLTFRRPAARLLAEIKDYAYRNMAVRNYTATEEVDYPFLCEIRATYLTALPKMYYQPEDTVYDLKRDTTGLLHDGKFMPIKNALEITVLNVLQYFFEHAKKETGEPQPYNKMSWAEHIGAIRYTTDKFLLKNRYPGLPAGADRMDLRKQTYLSYETDSDQQQEKEFLRCLKYVRVLNEASYKTNDLDRWVYLDGFINRVLAEKGAEVDPNGFIWETY